MGQMRTILKNGIKGHLGLQGSNHDLRCLFWAIGQCHNCFTRTKLTFSFWSHLRQVTFFMGNFHKSYRKFLFFVHTTYNLSLFAGFYLKLLKKMKVYTFAPSNIFENKHKNHYNNKNTGFFQISISTPLYPHKSPKIGEKNLITLVYIFT